MHELSIAMRVVEVTAEAVREQPVTVRAVRLRIGALAGVVPEALRFAWDSVTGGTALDGAALEIEDVPAVAWCPACDAAVELPGVRLRCPRCGGPTPDLQQGKELEILSLELDEEQDHEHNQTATADPRSPHADPQEER